MLFPLLLRRFLSVTMKYSRTPPSGLLFFLILKLIYLLAVLGLSYGT